MEDGLDGGGSDLNLMPGSTLSCLLEAFDVRELSLIQHQKFGRHRLVLLRRKEND